MDREEGNGWGGGKGVDEGQEREEQKGRRSRTGGEILYHVLEVISKLSTKNTVIMTIIANAH